MPGRGLVFLLALVRDRTDILSVTFVGELVAEQTLLGRCVSHVVLDAKLAYSLALLRHIDDKAIFKTARSASLVINRLDGGGHDFEIVVSFKSFVHLRLIPKLSEKACNDAKEGCDLGKQLVGWAVANGYGEEAVHTHFWTSCHGLLPGSIVNRPAHIQRREEPGQLLKYADPVLPHSELLRHLEAAKDGLFVDHQDGGQGVHPCEHLIRLAYLDEFVSFGHCIGNVVEGWPRNWVDHLVNSHRALVLDLCHAVHFHRLISGGGSVAGVRGRICRRWRGLRGVESVEWATVGRWGWGGWGRR